MANVINDRFEGLFRWTARLWSIPVVMLTFLLAAGPFLIRPTAVGNLAIPLSSLTAMAFAVAFVVAWRWERVGAWLALGCGLLLMLWFTIQSRHLALSPFDFLFWAPAILFLVAAWLHPGNKTTQSPQRESDDTPLEPERPCFFAIPGTNLGWWALLVGSGFFLFMRLFWMQAGSPGRNRTTFFSDPVNAGCLIGAFGSAIVGMILALVAIVWKRERSLFFLPLLLLGLVALLWALAVISGANA